MVSEKTPSNSLNRESVDNLILETMDSVLRKILGEGSAEIITLYAKKSYSIKGEETLKRVEALAEALRKILGFSSTIIENLILNSLYSKLELKFEDKKNYEFLDYIKDLRNSKFQRKNAQIETLE